MLKVLKFGGSSMADEKQFAKVRDIVRADDSRRVVVVSAAGKRDKNDHKITDLLYLCHAHLQYGVSCDGIYDMIRSRYVAIRDALGLKTPLEAEFAALREKMDKGISADELVSRGEYFAAELMADYLGFDFLDSSLWLKFKLDGTVDQEASYENLRRAASGRRVVIPGFYGAMPDGSVHTFSRGGSDITGALAAAALDAPPEEIIRLCVEGGYSRIPVYEGTIDNVVGVLYAKDLLARLAAGKPIEPAALKRDVLFVYRSKRISELLAEFRRAKQHMAVVTDEHGGTLGLVTMEDILEELVGEIWDETDKDETPIRQLSENSWQVEGDVNVEDFFDAIGFVDKTFDCDYNSVGGWALAELEHIPSAGESFGYKQLHVTIRAVKDQRIESLLVTRGEHGGGDAPPE